jgi:hypothetical protein
MSYIAKYSAPNKDEGGPSQKIAGYLSQYRSARNDPMGAAKSLVNHLRVKGIERQWEKSGVESLSDDDIEFYKANKGGLDLGSFTALGQKINAVKGIAAAAGGGGAAAGGLAGL